MRTWSVGVRVAVLAIVGGSLPVGMQIAFGDGIRDCSVASQVGETCELAIDSIHPTQFAVGYRAAILTERALAQLSDEDLKKEIKDKPAPLVIAPGGGFYIFDRHHFATALLGLGKKKMRAEVHANWIRMAPQNFFPAMEHNNWLWLYDENGVGPRSARDLPRSIRQLVDDPYRSLADAVQESGGFRKSDVPFAEFIWAAFFRDRVSLGYGEGGFQRATQQALALAYSPAARGLPGYKGR